MSMSLRTALVVVAGLTLPLYLVAADPADKPKLEGQHAIIAMERNGIQLDQADSSPPGGT